MWHFHGEHFWLERIFKSKLFGIVVPNKYTIWRYDWIIATRHNCYQIGTIKHLGYSHAANFVCVFVFK
jgi:hypothetical protein